VHLAEAAAGESIFKHFGIGQRFGPSGLAPEVSESSDGDIECAAGLFREPLSFGEDDEEIVTDLDGGCDGGSGAAKLTIGAIVRQGSVELSDSGEGGLECLLGLLFAGSIKLDVEERAHVGLDGFVRLERRDGE